MQDGFLPFEPFPKLRIWLRVVHTFYHPMIITCRCLFYLAVVGSEGYPVFLVLGASKSLVDQPTTVHPHISANTYIERLTVRYQGWEIVNPIFLRPSFGVSQFQAPLQPFVTDIDPT